MAVAPPRYIVALDRLVASDAEGAGGKASALGRLTAAGFPVPDGFVLTTAAFQLFLERAGVGSSSTAAEIENAPFPEDVQREAVAAAAALGSGPVAVRSSAIGEDAVEASFAGQYESILNVDGSPALVAAVRRCWASAFSPRLSAYRRGRGDTQAPRLAVVVQRMLSPVAAGVAFTANPVTGNRAETLVSVVQGLGERLVSGEANADEWVVRDARAQCRRAPEQGLEAAQVAAVATVARAVEALFGRPQDVEWAFDAGKLWVLQARPITALPELVDWKAPRPGGWTRNFRFGEWLPEPLTPLFDSWLLGGLERGCRGFYLHHSGIGTSIIDHVVIHGWYFGSLNNPSGSSLLNVVSSTALLLHRLVTVGRRAFLAVLGWQWLCIELFLDDRKELLARYRAKVDSLRAEVETAALLDLPAAIDGVAELAGYYYGLVTILAGFAWKMEVRLARFYQAHVEPKAGGSHQELLQGLFVPARSAHDVQSLDWHRPTLGELAIETTDAGAEPRRARLEQARRAAETRARAALGSEPKLLARFERLLARAQRFVPVRDQLVAHFTLGWPVMRQALARMGRALVDAGSIQDIADVHFLTRAELLAALSTPGLPLRPTARERRELWERQGRLAPPLLVGEPAEGLRRFFARVEAPFRRPHGGVVLVSGLAASPGRATGPARIIRGVADFARFCDGDVLVTGATMPAWTPLFPRAAAVVTDIGSVIAHAALVAREYGIPAVVATGNATATLKDGDRVIVDGTLGVVLSES